MGSLVLNVITLIRSKLKQSCNCVLLLPTNNYETTKVVLGSDLFNISKYIKRNNDNYY